MPTVDLNADLGESFGVWTLGDDDALLPLVTSANVACGFHAGDPTVLRRTCVNAVAAGVAIGAQVSYRDLAGFGRRFVDVSPTDLAADVLYQLGALDAMARAAGSRVRYLKPHGALYHATVTHGAQAGAVLDALESYDDTLAVLGLPGSVLLAEAERRGVRTVAEAFADRAYTPAGTLVPRGEVGAVLHVADEIAARVVRLVTEHRLIAVDGSEVVVDAASVCLHGDTAGAVGIAHAVRAALDTAGVDVASFV